MDNETIFEHHVSYDDRVHDAAGVLVFRPENRLLIGCSVWPGIGCGVVSLLPLWLLGWNIWLAAIPTIILSAVLMVHMFRDRAAIQEGRRDLVLDTRLNRLELFDERRRCRGSIPLDRIIAITDRHVHNGRYEHLEFSCAPETILGPVESQTRGRSFDREAWETDYGKAIGDRIAAILRIPITHDHRQN